MTEEIRERFRQLKLCGERYIKDPTDKKSSDSAVIDYMNHLLDSGNVNETKDICFALWNISDSYALLDTQEVDRASQLYNSAKLHGLPENAYINNRITTM